MRAIRRDGQGNVRAPVSVYEMQTGHFHSTAASDTQPEMMRDANTRQKAKHCKVTTEQYQKNRESVNNCVLFISQRFSIYH
jgi:hypothetical protein